MLGPVSFDEWPGTLRVPPTRVLVVDDEVAVSRALARHLRRIPGTEVIEAATVAEAKVAIDRYRIAVVICDFDLPDGTGAHVLGHWSAAGRSSNCFAFHTGNPEAVAPWRCKTFAKPANPQEIISFIPIGNHPKEK